MKTNEKIVPIQKIHFVPAQLNEDKKMMMGGFSMVMTVTDGNSPDGIFNGGNCVKNANCKGGNCVVGCGSPAPVDPNP